MAVIVKVELLSGRYHAHVWGESQFGMAGPEWPPSPWRLLRALASAWFSAQPRLSSEADRDALLEALGQAGPPEIWLPKASFHEVRYYQPVRLGGSDRVLHHDFFAVPKGGRFWFRFDVDLDDGKKELLQCLLARLRYFGRSESRALLRLVDLLNPPDRVHPVLPRDRLQAETNVTYQYRRVLCTGEDFRAADLWSVREDESDRETRRRTRRSPAGVADGNPDGYPPHLVDALLKRKKPLPDGARWVEYAVPEAIIVREIRPRPTPRQTQPQVKVAEIRFRLNRRIPIPLQSLVAVARAFRDVAVQRYGQISNVHSLILTGREADGSVARGHRHAFYLPQPSKTEPWKIESLLVRIPQGRLSQEELDALLGVFHIRIDGSPYPVTVVLESVAETLEAQEAQCWRSVTPFIPPLRYRPNRAKTTVEEQAADAAERACGVRPGSVQVVAGPAGIGKVSPVLAHKYSVEGSWVLSRRLGFWLEINFDKPVILETPLGADAHFGANQFEPC